MGQSLIESSKKLGNSQPLAPRRLSYAKISNMQNRLPLNGTGISLDGVQTNIKNLEASLLSIQALLPTRKHHLGKFDPPNSCSSTKAWGISLAI